MRHYHRLAEDDRLKRRTVADALEVLRPLPAFENRARIELAVNPWRLARRLVGLVDLEFYADDDLIFVVSLPSSAKFRALPQTARRQAIFDIFVLQGATVDAVGNVRLSNGTALRAVEVIPAQLPYAPSELAQRIVYNFILMRGAEDRCFPYLRDQASAAFRHMVPAHVRVLDCHALSLLEPPLLKVFATYLAEHDKALETFSLQTIADALAMFGVRPVTPRPRKRRAAVLP